MENAYPAGVIGVGYLSDIAAVSTPLRRPVAARKLKAITPTVAAAARIARNVSTRLACSVILNRFYQLLNRNILCF